MNCMIIGQVLVGILRGGEVSTGAEETEDQASAAEEANRRVTLQRPA